MASYKEITEYRIIKPGIGLGLLLCLFLFCLIVASLIMAMIPRIIARPEAAVRICAIVQDFLVFIIPAIATAMVSSRLPARFLAVDHWGGGINLILALLVMCVSMPAMNMLIQWNQNIHFPASMAGIEAQMRAMEASAEETFKLMSGGGGIGSLIVSILIIGVLAGFSEELFFRGALQRLLGMTRLNKHLAIWLTAFVFSAIHFQFFGFFPRLLLGAFFGYLLWWSGSLWLPVIAHIFNNTVVVLAEYAEQSKVTTTDLDSIGADNFALAAVSVVFTIAGIWYLRRNLFLRR